jgi:hypothetical protein
MGVGYYVPVSQWSRGEYPGANNFEDDVAKITTFIPYIADEYSNTLAGATPLTSGVTQRGLITTAADVDVFRLDAAAGAPISLAVQLVPVWSKDAWPTSGLSTCRSNLDVAMTLMDASGAVVATGDSLVIDRYACPNLQANLNYTPVTDGTFFVSVEGTGYQTVTTGYSDYASIGQYALTAPYTIGVGTPSPPPSPPPPSPPPRPPPSPSPPPPPPRPRPPPPKSKPPKGHRRMV